MRISSIRPNQKLVAERYDEAEQLLVPALETSRRLFGEENKPTYHLMDRVAKLYRDQGHYEKAEPCFIKAEETARRIFGNDNVFTNESVDNLIKLYEAWGKPEKAALWRAKIQGKSQM